MKTNVKDLDFCIALMQICTYPQTLSKCTQAIILELGCTAKIGYTSAPPQGRT